MASFTVTAVTALELIQDAKLALVAFIEKANITSKDLPNMKDKREFEKPNLFNTHKKECSQQLINTILNNKDAAKEIPNNQPMILLQADYANRPKVTYFF